ncbi:MAG: flagellar basal body rod protein FlgC [Oscillospiraceae bacterium]|jgi:flagellar basal-body rod protein FlgC|nr:flagellar basal body rod protein FlgC [Oscillospiraceae bacterium]
MAFLTTMDITGSALTAERFRINIISQNLTNMETTRTESGEPYRRKQVVFQERALTFSDILKRKGAELQRGGVEVAEIVESQADFIPKYDPSHPDADEDGYVMLPNVNRAEEQIDLMAASNAYVANLTVLEVIKSMAMKTLEIGK